jgi:Condensation domain
MFEQISRDLMVVPFAGAEAGTEPLTWGQKAILRDMRDSGNQFNMPGRIDLPAGSTVDKVTARLAGLMSRHAALRARLATDSAGRPCQDVAGSGRIGLDILTMPDDADPADTARFLADLWTDWPLARFDFTRDWPLRMAVVRHRGVCLHLAWVLSHLAADGGGHVLLLGDLLADDRADSAARQARHPDVLDIARSEQEPQSRQLSSRTMRYWESQLRDIPARTFAESASQRTQAGASPGERYRQVRFRSPAAHLAMLAIARRTGTDASRVTLALIAVAIARATGRRRLTIKVMVNNRFRPGFAEVIAPIAQNSVVTIDVADAAIDEVVARTRSGSLTAGMRAYYDPDELAEVTERLDGERGYPASVTCRVNDQRAMIMRADAEAVLAEVTKDELRQKLTETSLTWLGRRDNMHEQVDILIEPRTDVVSLHMMWDRWCLSDGEVEALLRGVEEVAVEAAFDLGRPRLGGPASLG